MSETQMSVCPNCNNQVRETAKFCPECGMELTPGASGAAWIAAMQEKIKYARENDLYYTIFGVLGVMVAIVIPLITRFVLKLRMDTVSWLLTGVGILFFIGSYVGTWYNGRKVKGLIRQLEKGQE